MVSAISRSSRPNRVDQLLRRPGLRVEAAEQVDQLDDGQVGIQRGGLELDADALLELDRVAPRVDAEHGDLAAVGLVEALEDLDRRRLAGAVGPEQAEDLAAADLEVDAVDGLDLAVALAQAGDADDGWRLVGQPLIASITRR